MKLCILTVSALLLAACSSGTSGSEDGVYGPSSGPSGHGSSGTAGSSGSGGTGTPPAAGDMEVKDFGETAGLKMFVHVPANVKAGAPVVVAMHGCTQTAAAYAGAGWNTLADARGFYVVYPEQQLANNFNRCFRWFEAAHTARGSGEPAAIAAMVDHVQKTFGAGKAYVTGLSAGGAMTAVMLATYPDVFEAGSVLSGLPYHCATSQTDAYSCMNPGKTKTPQAWGDLVRAAASGNAPRVQVWHGDADYTVRPMNQGEIAKQFANAQGIDGVTPTSETVGRATRKVYKDASGTPRVETFTVSGMGHGTPVDPKGGCGTAGAYILDTGLCSSKYAADFFGI